MFKVVKGLQFIIVFAVVRVGIDRIEKTFLLRIEGLKWSIIRIKYNSDCAVLDVYLILLDNRGAPKVGLLVF